VEQLLARDFAVQGEPQSASDWGMGLGAEIYLRAYEPPPAPASALWGGVNSAKASAPELRGSRTIAPGAKLGATGLDRVPHIPALLIVVGALWAMDKYWH
jgi:hypothetical protein